MTAPNQGAVVQALQRVLAAQHAAVYGYPVIGVALGDPGQVQLARQLEARHRHTRDELMAQLVARGSSPAPADTSYSAAEPVTGPASAQRWAVQLEQDCAAAYRYLLVAPVLSTGASGAKDAGAKAAGIGEQAGLRQQALTGLSTAALNATGWRSLLSPATPTVAFPGL